MSVRALHLYHYLVIVDSWGTSAATRHGLFHRMLDKTLWDSLSQYARYIGNPYISDRFASLYLADVMGSYYIFLGSGFHGPILYLCIYYSR